jgi:alanine dehydrogenase
MVLLLNRNDVMSVLEMSDCIDYLEKAFAEHANGTAVLPLRIAITPPDGLSLYMPAYLQGMDTLACKIVTVYKNNPRDHNMPTTIGKVMLQDPRTGDVICIMDGGYLTAVRTGAVSGLATKYLAREKKGMTAAVFGAGVQAKMQLWGVCEARDVTHALVHDAFPEAAVSFAKEMGEKLGIAVEITDDIDRMFQADIICTATSSSTPIFDGNKLNPGVHINGIGSHSPKARELDTTSIRRSLLIADSYDACLKECGDIMIPIEEGAITKDHIHAELGEIVTGKKPARVSDDQITLFKSNGLAIQDAATARLIYDRALQAGIGTQVDI